MMKFGLIQEGHLRPGVSAGQRYAEMVEEAVLAEEKGFDYYALSEQHFLVDICTVSAPEVLLGAIAARTKRIKIRFCAAVLHSYNHPIRVAERVTTLDALSNGRAELATARSNNLHTLRAFGVDPKDARAQWSESLEIIVKALTQDPFEHHGRFWDIPPRTLSPAPYPRGHPPIPPIWVTAGGVDSHRSAGERGIGVMTGQSIYGWDYAQNCVSAYKEAVCNATPIVGDYVHDSDGFFAAVVHCAETQKDALEQGHAVAQQFVDLIIWLFGSLAPTSPDYAYMSRIEKVRERRNDLDFLMEQSPYLNIGTPDYLVERFRLIEQMGCNEIVLRIDGMPTEIARQAISLIGEEVIPKFRSRDPGA
jgi:alkanesulfonate monooxygenase SsuD/methylene tetrahydromethanopterin reductase-like flavin-dependent oxidoreductase (luciferase family)